jgi:hypothetical protein
VLFLSGQLGGKHDCKTHDIGRGWRMEGPGCQVKYLRLSPEGLRKPKKGFLKKNNTIRYF